MRGNPAFEIRNLLSTIAGEFVQRPLTVLAGPDQDGRTQALYALHRFLREPPESGALEQADIEEVMHAAPGSMPGAGFRMTGGQLPGGTEALLVPAVRTGLHIFHHELRSRRTRLLHNLSRNPGETERVLAEVTKSRYPTPVAGYIDWLGCLPEIREVSAGGIPSLARRLEDEIALVLQSQM